MGVSIDLTVRVCVPPAYDPWMKKRSTKEDKKIAVAQASKKVHTANIVLLLTALVTIVLLLSLNVWQANGTGAKELPLIASSTSSDATVTQSLILGGDGGIINQRALNLLKSTLADSTAPMTVLFMGDNIYPQGLTREDSNTYAEEVRRLEMQFSAVEGTSAQAIFIPGNHDWADSGREGFASVKREEKVVSSHAPQIQFEPKDGCPGPVGIDLPPNFYLIVLDSQWWLHEFERGDASCGLKTEDELFAQLRELAVTKSRDRHVIIAQHHPLKSYGLHAGESSTQGLLGHRYALFIENMQRALRGTSTLICAAGHDHSLQILKGDASCKYYMVSGTLTHPTTIRSGPDLIYGATRVGFIKLDVLDGRRVRASIVTTSPTDDPPPLLLKTGVER